MTQKARSAVRYTVGTHAVEKMTPSPRAIRLCEKIADGHISANHAIEEIKRSFGLETVSTHG